MLLIIMNPALVLHGIFLGSHTSSFY